jgi:hypothetical protein
MRRSSRSASLVAGVIQNRLYLPAFSLSARYGTSTKSSRKSRDEEVSSLQFML